MVQKTFELLAKRVLPEGIEDAGEYLDSEGLIKQSWTLPIEKLPNSFQDFSRQVSGELEDFCRKAVTVLRWRCNMPSPHGSIYSGLMYWSLDGMSWKPIAGGWGVVAACVYTSWPTPPGLGKEIEDLLGQVNGEPVGHELLREARHFRDSHRRSSLLIGIAALEVGLKDFVSSLCPDTKWLIEHVPSPPVLEMLRDYLPALPVKCKIHDNVAPWPREEILEVLRIGIKLRNEITHVSGAEPSRERLERTLSAVEDVLWMLDYYRGFSWAINYVRPETRNAIGATAT